MTKIKILWFGIFSDTVKQMMRELCPEEAEPLFVTSKTDREEHLRLLAQADYISPNILELTEEYLRAAVNCKMIQLWGAGVDKYDQSLLRELDIALSNGAGFNAEAVAEMAVLHMLAVNRHLPYVDREMRKGRWLKAEMRDRCRSLYGKTVGVIGMGNIGRAVTRKLYGMDVARVIYYDAFRQSPENEEKLRIEFRELDDLMKEADIVTVHCPLIPSTRGMIDARRLALMKPDAILINTARGPIVDEAALIDVLERGAIRGAGLDSFSPEPPAADNPLFRLDNVVLTSHGGGAVIENIPPRIEHVYDCIMRFEHGEPIDPRYVVLKSSRSC